MNEKEERSSVFTELVTVLFELIILAVIVGIVVAKYLEAISPYLPAIIVASLIYLTWKHLLRQAWVRKWLSKAVSRSGMAYIYIFIMCGLLGCVYLFIAHRSIAKLDRMENKAKGQERAGTPSLGEYKKTASPPEAHNQAPETSTPPHQTPSPLFAQKKSDTLTKEDILGAPASLSSVDVFTDENNNILVVNDASANMYDVQVQAEELPDPKDSVQEMMRKHPDRRIYSQYFPILHPHSFVRTNIKLPLFPPEHPGWTVTVTNKAGGSSTTHYTAIEGDENHYRIEEFKDQKLVTNRVMTVAAKPQ